MKLSKLYCNQPAIFAPVEFNAGLNVVLAEVRLEEKREKDTHNVGKSTLGVVLNYCLLSRRDKSMFLFKHEDVFADFVFFLEIELAAGGYVTIMRGVREASKVSFKRHLEPRQDFSNAAEEDWDHYKVPFEKAKSILDGYLDFREVSPWDYRKGLGYFLRTQDDYSDVFKLGRFAAKHSDWKPYLAHILGLDGALVQRLYDQEALVEKCRADAGRIEEGFGNEETSAETVEGILFLKGQKKHQLEQELEQFDFWGQDKEQTQELVDNIDQAIARLNEERYTLEHAKKKIEASLDEGNVSFDSGRVEALFGETGVYFDGQLKRDYEQLVAFNAAITKERSVYLLEELGAVKTRLAEIDAELKELSRRRSEILGFLSETDVVKKYKDTSAELVKVRSDIGVLTLRYERIRELEQARKNARAAQDELTDLSEKLKEDIASTSAMSGEHTLGAIRGYFAEIVKSILDVPALLTVRVNAQSHPEFEVQILDDEKNRTSAQQGFSYKKILCIAFDLAVLRAHLGGGFPAFVFHDGAFESLDWRKKENLIEVMRDYAELGVQQIVTVIDTDLPARAKQAPVFSDEETVLRLHDEGPDGRLFKMGTW
ncbi:keratin [Corynebacterium phocae]|uniref:Keratin n=2 Tax=Corynebacterium phocae TaxID=161895 RepID=A0A1L7D135_9CORY|nr:keratin [Corynebacterium phocae]KAA8727970.1 DUF2326 domain-containing protein [Corynebacterium phocae]